MILLAIILGLIQALTEFLPVSSSGHLLLARAALDFETVDGLTFDVAVHVGTLLAIVAYFRRDIGALLRGLFRSVTRRSAADSEQRMAWYVVAACVPAGLVGFFFESAIERYLRDPGIVVVTLGLGALLFFAVERWCRQERAVATMTARSAIWIGLLQTLSLVPGVSRSGITIAAGMMCGFRRDEAARFSFVMVTPLLAGAGLKKGLDLVGYALGPGELTVLLTGLVTSALGGFLVVRFLIGFLRGHSLLVFAWYRLALATIVAVYLFI